MTMIPVQRRRGDGWRAWRHRALGRLATPPVLAGPIPPFQMVAMTFAHRRADRHRARSAGAASPGSTLLRWPVPVWLGGVGGLFGYHALYFAALQLAPPAEANLVNYLWPLLIVLLSAPLAGERLGWSHLLGAALGFAGVALLAFGRGASFSGDHALGYALALGCAFTWSLYSVLSRRLAKRRPMPSPPSVPPSALLSLACHLLFERTAWPASPPPGSPCWRSASARPGRRSISGITPVKRGDIRALAR